MILNLYSFNNCPPVTLQLHSFQLIVAVNGQSPTLQNDPVARASSEPTNWTRIQRGCGRVRLMVKWFLRRSRKNSGVNNGETSEQRKVHRFIVLTHDLPSGGGTLLSPPRSLNAISCARKSRADFPSAGVLLLEESLNRSPASQIGALSLLCPRIIKSDRLSSCVSRHTIRSARITTIVSNAE